jgi:hypothetical protein
MQFNIILPFTPNSVEQISSREADSLSASQEIPCLLLNPKVHYCAHKSLPLALILSQMNVVHILTPYFFTLCHVGIGI